MIIEEIMEKIDSFTEERDWMQFHDVRNLASSISIEAAELLEIFQWNNPKVEDIKQDSSLLDSISEEIADVMIYCFRLCSTLDLNPIEIIEQKLKINAEKYPVEKSRGSAKKYSEL